MKSGASLVLLVRSLHELRDLLSSSFPCVRFVVSKYRLTCVFVSSSYNPSNESPRSRKHPIERCLDHTTLSTNQHLTIKCLLKSGRWYRGRRIDNRYDIRIVSRVRVGVAIPIHLRNQLPKNMEHKIKAVYVKCIHAMCYPRAAVSAHMATCLYRHSPRSPSTGTSPVCRRRSSVSNLQPIALLAY